MKHMAVAIELGTSKVVVLIGTKTRYGDIELLGSGVCPYAGYRNQQWIAPEELETALATAIRDAEQQAHRKVKELYVGIPGDFIQSVCRRGVIPIQAKDHRVTHGDIDLVMEDAEDFPKLPEYIIVHRYPFLFRLDEQESLEFPIGMRGSQLEAEVCFTLAKHHFMEDMKRIMNRLGIRIKEFLPAPLGEGLHLIPYEQRDKGAVLIDMGYLTTDVSMFEGDALVYHDTIPLGGAHLTSDLAIALHLPMEQAEQLKRQYVFGLDTSVSTDDSGFDMLIKDGDQTVRISMQDVQNVIEARMEEIALMVKQSIQHSKRYDHLQKNVILTGGGVALMRGSREFLSRILEMPVTIATPKVLGFNHPTLSNAFGILDFALADPAFVKEGFMTSILKVFREKFVGFF